LYNRYGRRDNLFKARIKILVRALGVEQFTREVDTEFAQLEGGAATATEAELARIAAGFEAPPYRDLPADSQQLREQLATHPSCSHSGTSCARWGWRRRTSVC